MIPNILRYLTIHLHLHMQSFLYKPIRFKAFGNEFLVLVYTFLLSTNGKQSLSSMLFNIDNK